MIAGPEVDELRLVRSAGLLQDPERPHRARPRCPVELHVGLPDKATTDVAGQPFPASTEPAR